jgi:hypothetical protein
VLWRNATVDLVSTASNATEEDMGRKRTAMASTLIRVMMVPRVGVTTLSPMDCGEREQAEVSRVMITQEGDA